MIDDSQDQAHTASALEWPLLLERIAARCASRVSAERVRALLPASSFEESAARLALAGEVLELYRAGDAIPARDFPDVGEVLQRARAGGSAGGIELVALGRVLGLAKELRVFARPHSASAPRLSSALDSATTLDSFADKLAVCLDADGSVTDRASAELARLRARGRELKEDLKRRIGRLLGRFADVLQGQYYTERDGRYVLPVRSDAHLPVDGIVLGTSASGGTLYVEPREVTELGNRLRVLEAEAFREEARVLAELSRALAPLAELAEQAFLACISADRCAALARFALEVDAHVPLLEPDPLIKLERARHPLLVGLGSEVVPNDIELCSGQALVISGPNAGGKTVVLKTLGLFAWMARAGLPVPALPESRIGYFDAVLCDIGDEQSILRSLSTFSAHVERLAAILNAAGPRTLVLLDEVASGTDPEEGAVLAAAVLEALTERGAAVAVTTHYELLKELAARGGALVNASVGFDFERMLPSFRLLLGVPGASSALYVAARHGLSGALLERARALLPAHAIDREAAVRELLRERAELESLRADLAAERAHAAELARELEAERQAFRERAARDIEQEVSGLRSGVRSARRELEAVRARLRDATDPRELRSAERAVSRVAAQVAIGGELVGPARGREPRAAPKEPTALELRVGRLVRHKSLGTVAEVLELPERGQVRLRVGNMKLMVALSELELAPEQLRPARERTARPRRPAQPGIRPAAHRSPANTLDLRGERVEEALARVDAFLDRMLGEGEPLGFVLHGHGTGALKASVREHLAASRYVEHARPAEPDEGGDAFTVFWLSS